MGKNLLLTLLLVFTGLFVFSQGNNYLIIDSEQNLSSEDLHFIQTSLNKADLEKYRLQNKRRVLDFENGIKVILYSSKELKDKLTKIEDNQNIEKESHAAIFKILESGHILELHRATNKK